jgi:hypothetical protein
VSMTIWEEDEAMKDATAPDGTVWVCGACGKRASNRYTGGISHGWDESCMLHAVLCRADSIVLDGNRVTAAKAVGE